MLGEAGQLLVLLTPQSAHDEEQLGHYLASGHLDGAMLVSLHGADPLPGFLADRGIPVVVGGRPTRGSPVDVVDVDNVQGSLQAVRHLVGLGRRRIVTVRARSTWRRLSRLSGYRSALAEASIDHDRALELAGDFARRRARGGSIALSPGAARLTPSSPRPRDGAGAMAASAAPACAFRRTSRSWAYDDSPLALFSDPPCPACAADRGDVDERWRERCVAQLGASRQVPRSLVLATELVVRGSVRGDATEPIDGQTHARHTL